MYSRSQLEWECYLAYSRACRGPSDMSVCPEKGVRYSGNLVYKYAMNYVKKELDRNPYDREYFGAYSYLSSKLSHDSKTKFTRKKMEKMSYDYCENVDWKYNELSTMYFGDVILYKDGIVKYAKRYMQKNEPEKMDLKEILFFLDEDDFFDQKLCSYYQTVVIECFNEHMTEQGINYSFIKKHNKEIVMESFKRYCYDYCESHDWEYDKINPLTLKNVVYNPVTIREFAKEIMLRNEPVCMDYQKCIFFLEQDEYDFFYKYEDIARLILREHEDLKNIMNYSWLKDNFKSVILKYCFDLCEKYQWNYQNITKYCDDNSINFHSLMELCMIYYQSISKEFEKKQNEKYQDYFKSYIEKYFDSNFCLYLYIKEYGQLNIYDTFKTMNNYKTKRENSDAKFVTLFDQLLKSNDQKEIINIIQSREQCSYLKRELSQYVFMFWGFKDNTNDIYVSLNEKLNIFKSYLDENAKLKKETLKQEIRDEQLKCAEVIIQDYLDGDYYTIDDFCQVKNISNSVFFKYLEILKDKNHPLFSIYTDKQEKSKNERYARLVGRARQIISLMKSGVVENDKRRDFDLLDYYSMTKLNFDEFLHIIKDRLNTSDYRILRSFFAKYKNDKELKAYDLANIYDSKTTIGVQVDAKGRVIPNSGREVTLEEKKGIIRYLRFHNIPITSNTYNIAFRRWSKGMLNIGSQNVNDNGGKTR